jgi:hypothetical protein
LTSLVLGAGTFGVIYALGNWHFGGSSILEVLLIPGLVVGTVLSGGGPHGGNGLIWLTCLVVVNVIFYSCLWWLLVRRLPLLNSRKS